MKSVRLQSQVPADGVLTVVLPIQFADENVEVTVRSTGGTHAVAHSPEDLGWPAEFFEDTYGSFRDDPLERGAQGGFEIREDTA